MEDLKDLVPGEPETYTGLVQLLKQKQELGQTNAVLPWFWKVLFADGEGFTPNEQYQENIKVEWFLARECYWQWDEEILWLKREVASTVFTFKHHQRNWSRRADEASTTVAYSLSRRHGQRKGNAGISGRREELGYMSACHSRALACVAVYAL
ncbi:hypothetical protein BDV93DRAFT_509241 [Ceratobasidium sp. AG-I]|nr:hypothetical protein BDV93DRAFT_509241 [Ceratobasidium sp. AG-I]